MKKLVLVLFYIVVATHGLYSQQSSNELTKYGNLEGAQVEVDLFGNALFGGGSSSSIISILGGFQIGADFIFTLPQSKIYGFGIAPRFAYVPVAQNRFTGFDIENFELPKFFAVSHFEYGVSLFLHVSYYFSVGAGIYYNKVMPLFLDLDNDFIKTANNYNYQDHFSVRVQANFSKYLGESQRFAFLYGFALDLNILQFTDSVISFDARIDLGLKYRFYIGGDNAPVIRTQKVQVVDEINPNIGEIWNPPVDNYEAL